MFAVPNVQSDEFANHSGSTPAQLLPNHNLETSEAGSHFPSLALVHISDFHITGRTHTAESLSETAAHIASCAYADALAAESIVIAFTGDIAWDGSAQSFALAEKFVTTLVSLIEAETNKKVYVVAVPGNHDCVLLPEDKTRTSVIRALRKEPKPKFKKAIPACVQAQHEYFEFIRRLPTPPILFEDKLFTEYAIGTGSKQVRFSCFNIAWTSLLNEQQGTLIYPIAAYTQLLAQPAALRLGLIHHPFAWYRQDTAHEMERTVHAYCSVLMSGHEHVEHSATSQMHGEGTTLTFAGGALHPEEGMTPSFVVWRFEPESKSCIKTVFQACPTGWSKTMRSQLSVPAEALNKTALNPISAVMRNELDALEIVLFHANGAPLRLPDIYVTPTFKEKHSSRDATPLEVFGTRPSSVLIQGASQSGKTAMLRMLFNRYHSAGFTPLYLDSANVQKLRSPESIRIEIQRQASRQYLSEDDFTQAARERRVALVDDLGLIDAKHLDTLHQALHETFGAVIATCGSLFELRSTLETQYQKWIALPHYVLEDFTEAKRLELIRRWLATQSRDQAAPDAAEAHSTNDLINGLLGNGVVPAKPINILVLLQGSATTLIGGVNGAGLGECYDFLVQNNLTQTGIQGSTRVSEAMAFLSHLAWRLYSTGKTSVADWELTRFAQEFSTRSSLDSRALLRSLDRANLLLEDETDPSNPVRIFAYPYLYFYFVARYVSLYLDDETESEGPEIPSRKIVLSWCDKLEKGENANLLLFYAYRTNKSWMLAKLCDILSRTFSEVDLSVENAFSNCMQNATETLSVCFSPERPLAALSTDSLKIFVQETQKLMSAAHVAGHMIKTYYVDINPKHKEAVIGAVFEAYARFVTSYFRQVSVHRDAFLSEITMLAKDTVAHSPKLHLDEVIRDTALTKLMQAYIHGTYAAAACADHPKLEQSVKNAVRDSAEGTELMRMATYLTRPGKVPTDDIEGYVRSCGTDQIPPAVLGALASVHHLRKGVSRSPELQRLSSALQPKGCEGR